jgi:very-short-patch-repair endonuclease
MSRFFRSVWEQRIGPTESPIESAFLDAFCKLAVSHGYIVKRVSAAPAWVITVQPQRWFSLYRVDFLIAYAFFGRTLEIVVECDGHEFHERTKEQARRDKKRDRELQSIGLKVFRFAGSEIAASAQVCASDVLDQIEDFQTMCVVDAFNEAERRVA